MRALSSYLILVLATLYAPIRAAEADTSPNDLSITGVLPETLLQPLIYGNPLEDQDTGDQKRSLAIEGLLYGRQSCPAGYGECRNPGGCCGVGRWCYAGGCCRLSEMGCEGNSCCPTASRCCKGGGCCQLSQYCVTTSSGRRGCCPVGRICTGSGGSGGGSGSGSGGGGGTGSGGGGGTTTQRTTATQRTTSTRTSTTTIPASLVTTTGLSTVPTSVTSGYARANIPLDSGRLQWYGTWTISASSCVGTTVTKGCRGNTVSTIYSNMMQISFTGPSVYLKISSWNAGYAFKIDERNVQEHGVFSSRTTLTNCTYFSWTGTPGTHSLAVYVYGYAVSSSFSARDDIPALDAREAGVSESEGLERRDGGEWSFEINEVMVEDASTSRATSTASSGLNTPRPTNDAVGLRTGTALYAVSFSVIAVLLSRLFDL